MGGVTKLQLPRVEWNTRQDKEVGEVLEVSGGRRFVVATKGFVGKLVGLGEQKFDVGYYELVEEGTGEVLVVGFEYEVKESGK